MPKLRLAYGHDRVELDFADGKLLRPRPAAPPAPLADAAAAVRAALEAPTQFPPLRQALTPDDEVAVTLPAGLHQAPTILAAVLEHILSAGVRLENVTVLLPGWLGERPTDLAPLLPEPLRSVRIERHDRTEQKRLAYLAGTAAGRAVYLNRRLVDAGQAVVIGRIGYDPVFGYRGGLDELFPAFADEAAWRDYAGRSGDTLAGAAAGAAAAEAREVGWLLGLPFLVQILEGPEGSVTQVFAGTADSLGARSQQALDAQERLSLSRSADLALVAMSDPPAEQSFVEVVRAFAVASRAVRPGGAVVVLSRAGGEMGPAFAQARGADSLIQGLRRAKHEHAPDLARLWELAAASQNARLFLFSDLPGEAMEELSITPLEAPRQAQKLIDEAESVVLLPDAHRCLVEVARGPGHGRRRPSS